MEQCLAIYDYEAGAADELSFSKGDLITVIAKGSDSGWWKGVLKGQTGVFPNCFVSSNLERDGRARFKNKAKALYDYDNPKDPKEMRFAMGDVITIHKATDKSPGWWWGTNDSDTSEQRKQLKMFPSNFFTCNLVKALYNFAARSVHELSFQKDDVITVKRRWNDGWWEGKLGSREGIFPANYTASNVCTLDPPMFSNISKEVLKVGATECHVCAANEEIVSTMLRTLDEWHAAGRPGPGPNLFESIDIEPRGRPGSLLTPEDMRLSARQRCEQPPAHEPPPAAAPGAARGPHSGWSAPEPQPAAAGRPGSGDAAAPAGSRSFASTYYRTHDASAWGGAAALAAAAGPAQQ
eukprot:TRINITY_DN16668_c0_g1_i1.p1 TRINITY_DN16668_c0_g1~~TRINITY_DN16668_c0_g1_i1.p1  ORF type:complete len:351 (+),score=87.65 TRINITY_DN16668_c0_g1_i1:76-1128(+)